VQAKGGVKGRPQFKGENLKRRVNFLSQGKRGDKKRPAHKGARDSWGLIRKEENRGGRGVSSLYKHVKKKSTWTTAKGKKDDNRGQGEILQQ